MGRKQPTNMPYEMAASYWMARYQIPDSDMGFVRNLLRKERARELEAAHQEVQAGRSGEWNLTLEQQREAFLALAERAYRRMKAKPDVWGNTPTYD
jgi:hypothetical protein